MSTTSNSADAFARVSAALLAVWPSVADPAAGLTRAEVGRVLDECGSDYRPLVDLLLDLGRQVRPALASAAPQSPSSWVHVRAPLVHKLVATRFLQADVARWAVDVWGRVLGVTPGTVAASPVIESAGEGRERAATATPAAHQGAPAASRSPANPPPRAPVRPAVLTPQQVPAALKNVPSWAGGPVSFRVGQKPKASSLAALAQGGRVVVRSTVTGGGPRFQQAERRAALILGGLLVVISGGLLNAFSDRPNVLTPVDAMQVGLGSLVSGGKNSRSELATTGVGEAVAEQPSAGDEQRAVAPAVSAMPAPLPARALRPGMVPLPRGAAVREVGVGGHYVVSQRVRDVSGSESCDAVAQALAGGRETQETVSHVPGQSTFALVTRGVTGTLDSDGQFVSEPRAGTTNNVNWQFRMRGRFGPDGFTGESVTHTDAILRWGKIQTCVVTANLTGRKQLQ
jgi:hypothetical protein